MEKTVFPALTLKPEIRSRRGISPLRDGKKRRPSGRNDRFCVVDDVGETSCGGAESSQDNHLKQNETRSLANGQLRISG
jgi:hypothetical protein